MAKQITKRTLAGFNDYKVHVHRFNDLINMIKNKPESFVAKVLKESYWKVGNGAMKFDAIVGNPPYQIMDGGNSASATPVYNNFVEQAKNIKPDYVSMITPARWYVGGKGLDNFRTSMINDDHIIKLVDYPSCYDVFPTVDIAGGISYFLWDNSANGECEVINCYNGKRDTLSRRLNEYDVFLRSNKAVNIVNKVRKIHDGKYMDETVSASKPFGIRTFYQPKEEGIPCQFIQKIGLKYADPADITDAWDLLDKWKFLAPRSPIAGQTDFTKPVGFYYDGNVRIVAPGTCCTESFVVLFASDSEEEVKSFKTYIFTKVVRFLLSQCVVSQDITRDKYRFVPALEKYIGTYTDEMLCDMWNITAEEWKYIDAKIKAV